MHQRIAFRSVLGGLLTLMLAVPGSSYGHARLVDPKPRDNSASHKDPTGPCGAVRKVTDPVTVVRAGQTLQVRFEETVTHPGCFLISLSEANDQNFKLLLNVKHNGMPPVPTEQNPRSYAAMVNLPAGVVCDQCTLQLRQIMLTSELQACPPDPIPAGAAYYSCANLKIDAVPDMGAPPDLGVVPDLSPPPPPAPTPDLSVVPDPPPSGCSTVPGGTGERSAQALAWLMVLAGVLVRRKITITAARRGTS